MINEILVVFFVGGVIGLDSTAAWQVLISHPIIACTLIGTIFGDPQLGLFFGIIFELIWLYDVPTGGAKYPEGNIGSFVGLMIALSIQNNSNFSESWIILLTSVFAIIIAYIFGSAIVKLRKFNKRLIEKADKFAETGDVNGVDVVAKLPHRRQRKGIGQQLQIGLERCDDQPQQRQERRGEEYGQHHPLGGARQPLNGRGGVAPDYP